MIQLGRSTPSSGPAATGVVRLGTGIGWVDAHLLASSLLADVSLWTLDRPLLRQAGRLGITAAVEPARFAVPGWTPEE